MLSSSRKASIFTGILPLDLPCLHHLPRTHFPRYTAQKQLTQITVYPLLSKEHRKGIETIWRAVSVLKKQTTYTHKEKKILIVGKMRNTIFCISTNQWCGFHFLKSGTICIWLCSLFQFNFIYTVLYWKEKRYRIHQDAQLFNRSYLTFYILTQTVPAIVLMSFLNHLAALLSF